MFVRLIDATESFVLNLKVCDPAVSRFLYRKTFFDLLYNAEHKSDHVCHLGYTWNTAEVSANSLADCFPPLRTEFRIRYAEIDVFMKRKAHFATMWMSPLLSESRNLIQFHTESIQKSLVFPRHLLPSLLHTNIRRFSEPNFHEHEAFRLVSRERARQRWLHR